MAVRLTDKILPLNDAFVGMVDSDQVLAAGASGNIVMFGEDVLWDSGVSGSAIVASGDLSAYVLNDGETTDITNGTFNLSTTGDIAVGKITSRVDPLASLFIIDPSGMDQTNNWSGGSIKPNSTAGIGNIDFKIDNWGGAYRYYFGGPTSDVLITTLTEASLSVLPNTDTVHSFGRAKVGYDGTSTDWAMFSHYDNMTNPTFALAQNSLGFTILNAAAYQPLWLSINNSRIAQIDGNGTVAAITDSNNQRALAVIREGVSFPTEWYMYLPASSTDLRWFNSSDLMTLTASGVLSVTPDTDTRHSFGRLKIGNIISDTANDYAGIAHYDNDYITNYMILQSAAGETFVNSASGQDGYLRHGNINTCAWSSNYFKLVTGTATGRYLIWQRLTTPPTTEWWNYLPDSSDDLRWYNGADRMILSASGNLDLVAGDFTTTGDLTVGNVLASGIVSVNDGIAGEQKSYFRVFEGDGTEHALIRGWFYDTGLYQSGTAYQGVAIKMSGTDVFNSDEFTDLTTLSQPLKFSNYTSNGFLKTSGGNGTLSVDTATYLTSETDPLSWSKASNQTLLIGDKSGSFDLTTTGTVTIGDGASGVLDLTGLTTDVVLFSDLPVGNGDYGKYLRVSRNAPEGFSDFGISISDEEYGILGGNGLTGINVMHNIDLIDNNLTTTGIVKIGTFLGGGALDLSTLYDDVDMNGGYGLDWGSGGMGEVGVKFTGNKAQGLVFQTDGYSQFTRYDPLSCGITIYSRPKWTSGDYSMGDIGAIFTYESGGTISEYLYDMVQFRYNGSNAFYIKFNDSIDLAYNDITTVRDIYASGIYASGNIEASGNLTVGSIDASGSITISEDVGILGFDGFTSATIQAKRFVVTTHANLFPTMTSNTTPSGEVTAGGIWNDADYWVLLDKNIATVDRLYAGTGQLPGWIAYQFTSAQSVNRYTLTVGTPHTNGTPKAWTFQASNNGSTWTTLDSQSGIVSWTDGEKKTFDFSNSTTYTYFRLYFTEANGNFIYLNEWEVINTNPYYIDVPLVRSENSAVDGEVGITTIGYEDSQIKIEGLNFGVDSLGSISSSGHLTVGDINSSGNVTLSNDDAQYKLSNPYNSEYSTINRTYLNNALTVNNRVNRPTGYGNAGHIGTVYQGNIATGYILWSSYFTGDVTAEAWVYQSGSYTWGGFCNHHSSIGFSCSVTSGNGKITVHMSGTDNGGNGWSSSNAIVLGQWNYVAVRFTAATTELAMWINGVKEIISTTPDIAPTWNNTTSLGILGGETKETSVDEVKIWNVARTDEQILASYNGGAGSAGIAESGLVVGYHLDETSGSVVANYSSYGVTFNGTVSGNDYQWVTGHVTYGDTAYEITVLDSRDGGPGEKGIVTFGYSDGRTILDGQSIRIHLEGSEVLGLHASGMAAASSGSYNIGTPDLPFASGIFTTVISGSRVGNITGVSDTYLINVNDETIICDKPTDFVVTLPDTVIGQMFNIKNVGSGVVTASGYGDATIDDELTQSINQWECLSVQCYSTNKWGIL